MKQPQQQQLLHFCDSKRPLLFKQDDIRGEFTCCGCQESVYGPSYRYTTHHKSCAELPLGLHHPLHPIHPLILFDEKTHYPEEDKQKTKCQLCNESRRQYTYALFRYRYYRCDFNLHATCASLPPTIESSQVHHHPLTPSWKWITFTCDLCGKEVKGIPNQCALCGFWVHNSCASLPRSLKVLCVQKVNTNYGFYYCSKCDFVAHLNCAADYSNRENINLENEDLELDQFAAYEVKNIKVGEDRIAIAIEIKHFSHGHDLKLSGDEVLNNEKCNGCVNCSFFLHESCAKLPRKKRHPLHQHPLTLLPKPRWNDYSFQCIACNRDDNGFNYNCETCWWISLDVSCSLILDILTHPGHEHRLLLSSIESKHNCSSCDSKIYPIFRCTTCEFALDFKCATLSKTTRYKLHEHPFTLCYITEDDSGEYYCDICEEERNPKHWFYYCTNCDYPAHTKCILGENPNVK
ncbi:hypothetical protein ACB092_11G216500 [Castanea dentata]